MMRLYSRHELVRRHDPRELRRLLREYGTPAVPYLRSGQPNATWPTKDENRDLVLVIVPGEPAFARAWMDCADRVVEVDLTGRETRVLKSNRTEEPLLAPAKPKAKSKRAAKSEAA